MADTNNSGSRNGCAKQERRREFRCCSTELADTYQPQREGNQRAERIGTEYSYTCSAGWWEAEPNVGRVANGVPNRIHRLKGLGNAQVPLQAAVAWKLLGGE